MSSGASPALHCLSSQVTSSVADVTTQGVHASINFNARKPNMQTPHSQSTCQMLTTLQFLRQLNTPQSSMYVCTNMSFSLSLCGVNSLIIRCYGPRHVQRIRQIHQRSHRPQNLPSQPTRPQATQPRTWRALHLPAPSVLHQPRIVYLPNTMVETSPVELLLPLPCNRHSMVETCPERLPPRPCCAIIRGIAVSLRSSPSCEM